jgi:hypothetical protein
MGIKLIGASAYDSFRIEVLCDILFEFGIPMKMERLIKMCLNET